MRIYRSWVEIARPNYPQPNNVILRQCKASLSVKVVFLPFRRSVTQVLGASTIIGLGVRVLLSSGFRARVSQVQCCKALGWKG